MDSLNSWIEKYSKPVPIPLLAIWFGLCAGFAEAFFLLFRKYYQHRMLFISHHFPWTIPLGNLIIFLVVGSLLNLILLKLAPDSRFRVIVLVLSSMVPLTVFLHIQKLAPWASIILALGLGVTAMRLILAHKASFNAIVRLTLPWMCILLVVVAAGMLIFYL
jgi:hypothetical protein